MRNAHWRRGFTQVELLMVIGVIAVLVVLLIPAVQAARSQARATQCLNNLKQIGMALQSYESAHGLYPPSIVRQKLEDPLPPANMSDNPNAPLLYQDHWTGFHLLLSHLGAKTVYERLNFDGTWLSSMTDGYDRRVWEVNQSTIATLVCPSVARDGTKIGAAFSVETGDAVGDTLLGDVRKDQHWMGGSPTDYSFSHGADNIQPINTGLSLACLRGLEYYWNDRPRNRRGAFGLNSDCRLIDFTDGMTYTFVVGEKAGSLLTYSRPDLPFGTMRVEYPWGMAAAAFYAATGYEGLPGSNWVVAPYAVTRDIRLPDCPDADPGAGIPHPMNPGPRALPPGADERAFFSFQSAHSGGAYFLFADGAARILKDNINQGVFEAMSTISAREDIGDEEFK